MRYTHPDTPRTFTVPFGRWLIPVVGSILCILLMATVEASTGYRFLIWTAIGQIIYFSYGYRHSKLGGRRRRPTLINRDIPLAPVANAELPHDHNVQHEAHGVHEQPQVNPSYEHDSDPDEDEASPETPPAATGEVV